ncbi:S8 family serine peptidase [Geodermatophilus maliterrae]|uniref:S8 family serine peptidase n=1 Tax=Geodermatophilus maliterrae TaxID=3162531 RepID=A0ABV3XLR7_9ACTN
MSTLRRRTQAGVLVTAVVAGYAGAAAYTALAAPAVAEAEGFGPGDGLTRYVVTATSGNAAGLLDPLGALDGVASAQRLSDGRALVATDRLDRGDLAALDGVASVEVSPTVEVFGSVSDPWVPAYGWNLVNTGSNAPGQTAVADADTDAPDGWDAGTGSGVVVAVVDTGYDTDHEDLAGALWTNPAEPCGTLDTDGNGKAGDCHGWNFTTDSPAVDNGAGGTHGASVAGAVGARADNGRGTAGVAPGVTIMPLVAGSGSGVDVVLGAEAIRYAADHGADVVNASWGGPMSGWALETLRSAVAYAGSKGVLVIAAAGNDATDRDRSPVYPASLTEGNVVTVGASTAGDTVSSFSAYGATSVDLFAPGSRVFTTWNDGGYRLVDGTSIAAPQVAGAAALYRAALPHATVEQVRLALLGDVDPVAAFRGRSVTGGRLSVAGLTEAGLGAVDYSFSGTSAPAGVIAPRIAVSGTAAPGTFGVTLGLGMQYEGSVWAVAGHEIGLDGATVVTDDEGQATFTLGARTTLDGLSLAPTTALGDGRYVLTVQLTRDGAPVGSTRAAPLLVGAAAAAPDAGGGSSGGGPTGDGSTGDGSTGDGSTGGGSGDTGSPGTDVPDTGDSGTGESGTGESGTGAGGSGDGGSSDGGSGAGDGGSGAGDGGSGDGGSGAGDGGAGTPDTDNGSGTGTPGGSGGWGSTPVPSGPGTTPVPDEGGRLTFPARGQFQITSISPVRVSVDGGTEVRITGLALPLGARVLVGTTGAAQVVSSTATDLVFRTPARVAGRYDVTVFAPDGRLQVLGTVLEYVGSGSGGSTTPPGDGSTGGTDPATGDGGGTPGTGDGTPPGGGSGTGPEDADDSGAAPSTPAELTGPGGLRLVRSARLAAVPASLWALDCSVSCRGLVLDA